jgi:hypothetical protein
LQELLSSCYGTFDSENGDSDQHSCNLVVKGLFGDVSGNVQLDFNFIPWLRCGVSMWGLVMNPSLSYLAAAHVGDGNHKDKRSNPD